MTTITFDEKPLRTVNPVYTFADNKVFIEGVIATDADQPTSPVLSGPGGFQDPIEAVFQKSVGEVGLDLGSLDRPDSVRLVFYDTEGDRLASFQNDGTGVERFEYSSAVGIGGLSVEAIGDAPSGFSLDNLEFTTSAVPAGPTAGDDVLTGTAGNETIDALAGNDEVRALGGNDTVAGGAGNDSLYGDAGDDALRGGLGNDLLSGGAGADTLSGGAGDDRVGGGEGRDVRTGGQGQDAFLFSKAELGSRDLVTDFGRGQDKLDLSSLDANTLRAGNQAFRFVGTGVPDAAGEVGFARSGGDTFVRGNTDGDAAVEFEIQLTGGYTLAGDDFVL